MDIGRLLQSVFGGLIRRFAMKAAMKGIDHVARGGKSAADQTPAGREQARRAREITKRARQAARLTRRIGR